MKVILYMAATLNGYIADDQDKTSWISKEEWDLYSAMVQSAGCLIIGRRTYHILTKQPEFQEIVNVKVIIVSHESFETLAPNHIIAHSPADAIDAGKEFERIILAGGGILNASFLKEKLVDEIYIDIEPYILPSGIPLFKDGSFDNVSLKLLNTRQFSNDEIQLQYQIIK